MTTSTLPSTDLSSAGDPEGTRRFNLLEQTRAVIENTSMLDREAVLIYLMCLDTATEEIGILISAWADTVDEIHDVISETRTEVMHVREAGTLLRNASDTTSVLGAVCVVGSLTPDNGVILQTTSGEVVTSGYLIHAAYADGELASAVIGEDGKARWVLSTVAIPLVSHVIISSEHHNYEIAGYDTTVADELLLLVNSVVS